MTELESNTGHSEVERSIFLPFNYMNKPSIPPIGNPTTFMEHLKEYATAVFGQNIADGQKDQWSMYHPKTPRERKPQKRRNSKAKTVQESGHKPWGPTSLLFL